jgi:hydrogenase/urease accessory protein HupE
VTWEPQALIKEKSGFHETWRARASRFLQLGVHHVLTGYDHLLFLVGVLLSCRRLRTLWLLVSCFTVAHALTLGAALLGGLNAPERIVEPLIAASIVVVGLENLWLPDERRARYFITFAFGLIHGLGFASALRAHEVGPMTWLPLVAFNLGVELSQLVVASVLLPALWLLRARRVGPWVLRALSMGVVLMGSYWLVQRLVFA